MKVVHIVGARPNFMKAAPVITAIRNRLGWPQVLVHTGQHYDENMSDIFFRQLGLPRPDVNMEVGSGTHAQQTADVMVRFEQFVMEAKPDMVVVYGDVNSTVATALVCAKMRIPLAHVEAGLRSFDMSMPEEVNRVITDRIADLLFTPSRDGDANLTAEGVAPEKVYLVGNVMIDTLVRLLESARSRWAAMPEILAIAGGNWHSGHFGLVTLHRPSNVDDPGKLASMITTLNEIAERVPLIFPVHPRTRKNVGDLNLSSQLLLVNPIGYLDFLALQDRAAFVITDSGGIQEETTYLGTPCLTLRKNTERPVTVEVGTNTLLGDDLAALRQHVDLILRGEGKKGEVPELWDGHASERIAQVLEEIAPARSSAAAQLSIV